MASRLNIHMTHLEDLVTLGKDGLNELKYKLGNLISDKINYTQKIDGAPAVIMWSHIDGYPDNSICLKSFVRGPENALSSLDEIAERYGDRPQMADKLKYCLDLAKCIPEGEAWQGDCLFTESTRRPLNILGKEYLTFQPNKVIYAISEDSPSYNKVENSLFGICLHTIYKGTAGNFSQSFRVDLNRLTNVPSDFYLMTPALEKPKEIKISESLIDKFLDLSKQLESDPAYEELTSNVVFMKYWNMFENKFISDKAVITLDLNAFEDDLKNYIDSRLSSDYEKKISTLKTDKGKERAKNAYEQSLEELDSLVDNNHNTLRNLVDCLNTVAEIKMELIKVLPEDTTFNSFFNSKSKGYIPTSGEGIAMSDSEGNVVKLVDRSTFSNANRDDDILRGFEEDLDEKLEGEKRVAVVAFGRMNPPTISHKMLVDKVAIEAQKVNGDALLYLSHSQDSKKNPLDYQTKLKFCRKAFTNVNIVESNAKTLVNVLEELNGKYTDIIYVCGSDRLEGPYSADKVLTAYNNKPDKTGKINYSYNSINFVSAGNRDIDSNDKLETVSGSMARQFAIDNDFESFEDIVPFNKLDAKELFIEVRKGLGLDMLDEELLENNKGSISKSLRNLFAKESYIEIKQTSSRHPQEVARIKPIELTDVGLVEKVKKLLLNEFENIQFGDYGPHAEASHTYNSLEFSVDSDTYYITISTKAKKEFVPVKLLDQLDNVTFDYKDLYEHLHYEKDSAIENILKVLAQEATTASSLDQSIVKNNIEYQESDPFSFNFKAPETVKALNALDQNQLKLIESGIKVDFAEVFGAVGLAASIDKVVGGNIKIIYPSASNQKLLDYTISVNGNEYRVSAKTGAGAKPSSTSMFESISKLLQNGYTNPDLEDGIEFCNWFFTNVTGASVNDGYQNIAKEMYQIAKGDYSKWRKAFKGIPDLSLIAKDCEEPFNNSHLSHDCNELARNLNGNIIEPMNDNYKKYPKQYAVKCLVSLFVNIINATHNEEEEGLIDQINELFKKSYGSLIQVYAHPNLESGYFTFDTKYFTESAGRYIFNNNVGLEQSGVFKNNKLAIKLVK